MSEIKMWDCARRIVRSGEKVAQTFLIHFAKTLAMYFRASSL